MARLALSVVCSLLLIGQSVPALAASSSTPELKFKIYAPSGGASSASSEPAAAPAAAPASEDKGDGGFWTDAPPSAGQDAPPAGPTGDINTTSTELTPDSPPESTTDSSTAEPSAPASSPPPAKLPAAKKKGAAKAKTAVPAAAAAAPAAAAEVPAAAAEVPAAAAEVPAAAAEVPATEAAPIDNDKRQIGLKTESAAEDTLSSPTTAVEQPAETPAAVETTTTTPTGNKVLQGYIRVVPTGTKIPIIMDTAVDSDTSQEGDEFAARTSEDLNIDGSTVVPAGSVIKGRIAALNAPRALMRSGSVALKFDTVTTPDNRQIPLVANIVARGGVVHARRGMKDIAIDTGTIALPTLLGLGIGALAGGAQSNSTSSTSIGRAGGAMIGAGVGVAIGVIVLCAKKGKKVDVRPGDELKIELAEDLRMPIAPQ